MTKYAVKTESFEFNPTKHSNPEDAFFAFDNHNDKTVAIFDTLDEAKSELEKHSATTNRYSYKLARATVFYIEEAEYEEDEDGEPQFICGADIYSFAQELLTDDAEEEEAE